MRILCAPDTFKESLSARHAALAMRAGIELALRDSPVSHKQVEVDLCPIADGGDGTVDALITANEGEFRETTVTGPLGEKRTARWGVFTTNPTNKNAKRTAVIETSSAAGLALITNKDKRNPLRTTTFGLGELISAALDDPLIDRIIVGLGGSATCDGGLGVAQALGARIILDDSENPLTRPVTGSDLVHLAQIDFGPLNQRMRNHNVDIVAACDVTNPLLGPNGSAHIYGPQKGASPADVEILEAGLSRLASLLHDSDSTFAGAGAAGGLGFGLVTFLGARLERGIELILKAVHFDQRVQQADLILTGEGRIDSQTLRYRKAACGVAETAHRFGKHVIALVGRDSLSHDATLTSTERDQANQLFAGIHSLMDVARDQDDAQRNAAELLTNLTHRVVSEFLMKKSGTV